MQRAVVCVALFYILVALNVHALWSVAMLSRDNLSGSGGGSHQRTSARAPLTRTPASAARSSARESARSCRAIDDPFTHTWNYVKV